MGCSPRCRWVRAPIGAVTREQLPDIVHWLVVDVHLAAPVAVASVRRLVPRWRKFLRGVVLTARLNDATELSKLDSLRSELKQWGFPTVRVVHLPAHGREVAIVAWPR